MVNNFLRLSLISLTLTAVNTSNILAMGHPSQESNSGSEESSDEESHDDPILQALLEAALNHDLSVLINYLLAKPDSIKAQDGEQAGILRFLALYDEEQLSYEEHLARMFLLVDAGADINAEDFYGDTPLRKAAMNGHLINALRVLIKLGADLTIGNPLGAIDLDTEVPNKIACRGALIAAGASGPR